MLRFWRRNRDADLDEEVRDHLRQAEAARVEEGMLPPVARAEARKEFGNVTLIKEITRETWSRRWLDELIWDSRDALRQFKRHPGFTTIALTMLALGIGANGAVFTLANGVLFRGMPHI